MAWYAYCLTEHQTLPNGTRTRRPFLLEGVQGVNGAAVLSYPSGEFAVIVSEYDHTAGELDQKSAIEHARVVSNCFRNSTVLPFKFGTIFDSDDALRLAVRVNRRAFGLSVAKLRGKSEMHIKLVVRDGSLREAMIDIELPDTVGGDYLSKLKVKASRERERQTKARALSVQVHKLFNPLEEEVSCKKSRTGRHVDRYRPPDRFQECGKVPEPLHHRRQAIEELRSRDQRSLASLSFSTWKAAHRRRQQLTAVDQFA